MQTTGLNHQVHIVHRISGRVRLRVHRQHRRIDKMHAIEQALLHDLAGMAHAVRVDPLTGSILVHHNDSQEVLVRIAVTLAQFGLSLAFDELVVTEGSKPSILGAVALALGGYALNLAIDYLGIGFMHRVFLFLRVGMHLYRMLTTGINPRALAWFAADLALDHALSTRLSLS